MNSYQILDARLVADPEKIELRDGKAFTKMRLADNPIGKKDDKRPARFVSAKLFGQQGEAALRLRKGDVIAATGALGVEAYKAKDGSDKTADVMTVQAFRVHKSETFFADKPKAQEGAGEGDPAETVEDLFR